MATVSWFFKTNTPGNASSRCHGGFHPAQQSLIMGFINSVSVAQIHRRVISQAFGSTLNFAHEVRRDRELPSSLLYFRICLDNFDLLSVQSKGILSSEHGSLMEKLRDT